jgi:DNA polymerase III epsilon subunit-like protein
MREMVKRFKIKNAQWHDALDDARVTYAMFKKLMRTKHE